MSDYTYVADRAKRAFASVSKLESLLRRSPEDRALQTNLVSMRRVADRAREDLENLARINQIEICQYRLVPEADAGYPLQHVAKSLLAFQQLFSQLHDALKNGPKEVARIGREVAEESTLDFAYSYAGSLGAVLLTKSERDFFSGNLDKPIEATYEILEIGGTDTVRDIAHSLGRAVVKRLRDWSSANVEGGYSADVRWKRSDGRDLGQMVDRRHLGQIVKFIDATADETTRRIEAVGMLVAASMPSRSFHLTEPGGDSYRGRVGPEVEMTNLILGQIYRATIVISEVFHYATEQTERTNTLLEINLIGPPTSEFGQLPQ